MLSHIHHLTFVVHDLDAAVDRYRECFGLEDFTFDDLDSRDVRTARVALGPTWLVLVQPRSDRGVPAQHLAEHGEGLLLMSLAVDNLDSAIEALRDTDCAAEESSRRRGLGDWAVVDLAKGIGAHGLQLTMEPKSGS